MIFARQATLKVLTFIAFIGLVAGVLVTPSPASASEEHYTLSGRVVFPEGVTQAERESVEISAFSRGPGGSCMGKYCMVSKVDYDAETGKFSVYRLAPMPWELTVSALSSNGGVLRATLAEPLVDLSAGDRSDVVATFNNVGAVKAAFTWGSNSEACDVPSDPTQKIAVIAQEVTTGAEYPSGGAHKGDGCVEEHHFEIPSGTYRFRTDVFGKQIYLNGTVHGTNKIAEADQIEVAVFDYLAYRINLTPWLTGTGVPSSNPPAFIVSETYRTNFSEHDCQARLQSVSTYTPDTWGDIVRYQWMQNGVEIPGANRNNYQAAESDNGSTLSAIVTSSLYGAVPIQVISDSVVANCAPITIGNVSVSGTPEIGGILYATVDNVNPFSVQVGFQWQRSGVDIVGATSDTYEVGLIDAGHSLSVIVTGTLANRIPRQSVSEPVTIAGLAAVVPGTVSVTGLPEAGETLTVTPNGWAPSGTQYSYQWHRSGTDIVGATSVNFTPGTNDIGEEISATVTGTADGFSTAQLVSTAVTITKPLLRFGPVEIYGGEAAISNASLGQILSASLATSGPAGTAYVYQWFRNGAEIRGAESQFYTVTEADLLSTITARVSASADGYTSGAVTSASVQVIEMQLQQGSIEIVGAPKLGSKLRAQLAGWGPGTVLFTYQWLRDNQNIVGATKAEYTLTEEDQKHAISVIVSASKPGYSAIQLSSQPIDFTWKWPQHTRVSGMDRFATAAEISKLSFPNGNGVTQIVLATGYGFADALSAAPFASKLGAPLLLTAQDHLSDAARDEIERLDPDQIIIIGGPGAVGYGVETQLISSYEVTRIFGQDRFSTSLEIAHAGWGNEGSKQAFIATGTDFPDALSAGAAAAAHGMPVILVPGSDPKLPTSTMGQLWSLGTERVSIAGGTTAVSEGIANHLEANRMTVDRYSGGNRFGTSASIAAKFGIPYGGVLVASGFNYPDALAGAAVAGKQGATLVLAAGTCMPWEFQPVFNKLAPDRLVLLGGPSAVADTVARPVFCN